MQKRKLISLLLEHDDLVLLDVAHVDVLEFVHRVRVLGHQQPTDVRVEEPASRVVRVGVGLGVFVVQAVVERPLVDAVLEGQRVHHHEQQPQRQRGLVAAVAPQAVRARRHAHAARREQKRSCKMPHPVFTLPYTYVYTM